MSEDLWRERAQTAETKYKTAMNSIDAANQRVQDIKRAFGIKEKHGGQYTIDFAMLVENLGPEQSAELRKIIDEKYGEEAQIPDVLAQLVGKTVTIVASGDKPKLRVHAERK